mmetsp:Transcript_45805/g.76186  ORF Transcript_45805/g.76186 Transcript_45805/m.76186 type:complete len:254 (-) Transcript_45805:54-815(-)
MILEFEFLMGIRDLDPEYRLLFMMIDDQMKTSMDILREMIVFESKDIERRKHLEACLQVFANNKRSEQRPELVLLYISKLMEYKNALEREKVSDHEQNYRELKISNLEIRIRLANDELSRLNQAMQDERVKTRQAAEGPMVVTSVNGSTQHLQVVDDSDDEKEDRKFPLALEGLQKLVDKNLKLRKESRELKQEIVHNKQQWQEQKQEVAETRVALAKKVLKDKEIQRLIATGQIYKVILVLLLVIIIYMYFE